MAERQWLRFTRAPRTTARRTEVWDVVNIENGSHLGRVRWHGAWRAYCFFAEGDVVWNAACLRQLTEWLDKVNAQHRRLRAREKAQAGG